MNAVLATAQDDDELDAQDLQQAIDWFGAQASALDALLDQAADVATLQAIGRTQEALRARAQALVQRRIGLLAGEARITGAHIQSAVDYAEQAVADIGDVAARLRCLGQVLDFFAVVATGQGNAIVSAAVKLREDLG